MRHLPKLAEFAAKVRRDPRTKNVYGFGIALIIAISVWGLAGEPKNTSRYSRVFPYSHKEEFTTSKEIRLYPSREWETLTYPAGTKIRILYSYEEKDKTRDPVARVNAGTISPLVAHLVLIGETNEQTIIPTDAIFELGGTSTGSPIKARSIQGPAYKTGFPEIIGAKAEEAKLVWEEKAPKPYPVGLEILDTMLWTGVPTGDENVPCFNPEGERRVWEMANNFRKENGLPPLEWNEDLARGARWYAADLYMNNYSVMHVINDTRFSPQDALGLKGTSQLEHEVVALMRFYPRAQGANLGSNALAKKKLPDQAKVAFQGWKTSPRGHREAMLRPQYRSMVVANVGTRWVMAFGD